MGKRGHSGVARSVRLPDPFDKETMSSSIIIVLTILGATVVLLVLDVVRMDIVAILCLLALTWTRILDPTEALSGFSSNAVIAMVAVMILGRGITKTGMMDRFAQWIVKRAGPQPSRVVALASAAVGLLSALIQNVGAVVLFLPALVNLSRRQKIPLSQLIMPIGFAAIMGGTLTMVGSGPLILINDLIAGTGLQPYGLFSVAPVGLVLLVVGIAYFYRLGSRILPRRDEAAPLRGTQQELIDAWQLPFSISHYRIPVASTLVGKTPEEAHIWDQYQLNLLGISRDEATQYAPWRETRFEARQDVALLGEERHIREFATEFGLLLRQRPGQFETLNDPRRAGFAEVIVPPRSSLVGETIRQYSLRKRHGVEPVMLHHKGEVVRGDFSDVPIAAGDTLIVHGLWDRIRDLGSGTEFVLITPTESEAKDESKTRAAALCFGLAIVLGFSGFAASTAFLTGAMAMVLVKVLNMEEAYQAIEWQVVFFLAGLIPLGLAMQKTGAAAALAGPAMRMMQGSHPLALLLAVALASAAASLLLGNVAGTVILAPMVLSMARLGGHDPRPLALMVAIGAANSFILPTHQVNALLKTRGGYRNVDYLRAGSGLTAIFLVVVVVMFYLFYL